MYDLTAIESINVEQLVTATDRLLLRGRLTKRRPSTAACAGLERPTPARASSAANVRVKTLALLISMFMMAMFLTTLF